MASVAQEKKTEIQLAIEDFAASHPAKRAMVSEFPFGSVIRVGDDPRDFYVFAWSQRALSVVPYPLSYDMTREQYDQALHDSVDVCVHCAREHKVKVS